LHGKIEGGRRINWAVTPGADGSRLVLNWCEQGGPPVAPPTRKGFGSWVIERGLAHELNGKVTLDYHAGGVACTIDIPAPTETEE
jgi:two-component sensor histidine kinase